MCVREGAVGNLSSLNPSSCGVFLRAVTNLVGIFRAAPSLSHVGSKERQQWLTCCLKDNWKDDFIRGHSSRNVGMLSRITLHRECVQGVDTSVDTSTLPSMAVSCGVEK